MGIRPRIVPVSLADAKSFIALWHRHHAPPIGHKFSIGASLDGELVGVAIVGRPTARGYDDGTTLEVTRVCVADDCRNMGSFLCRAAARAGLALGYRRIITYTQADESGSSLRAAGYRLLAERPARAGWDAPTRRRTPKGNDGVARYLWESTS